MCRSRGLLWIEMIPDINMRLWSWLHVGICHRMTTLRNARKMRE